MFREVKTSERTKKKQVERAQAAVDALNNGGRLPSSDGGSRLAVLQELYVTNLKQLNDLLQLAKWHGCRGMQLPQGRALVASSLPVLAARWKDDIAGGSDALDSAKQQAFKRAGIANAMHHIVGYSGDKAARSPLMAPWSIYPFSPIDCAALICDMLVFDTTVSANALLESLEGAGLRGEVLLTPADVTLQGSMPVIRASWRDRAVTWHALHLNQLLYELAEPDALARGMREVLSRTTHGTTRTLCMRRKPTAASGSDASIPGTGDRASMACSICGTPCKSGRSQAAVVVTSRLAARSASRPPSEGQCLRLGS